MNLALKNYTSICDLTSFYFISGEIIRTQHYSKDCQDDFGYNFYRVPSADIR